VVCSVELTDVPIYSSYNRGEGKCGAVGKHSRSMSGGWQRMMLTLGQALLVVILCGAEANDKLSFRVT